MPCEKHYINTEKKTLRSDWLSVKSTQGILKQCCSLAQILVPLQLYVFLSIQITKYSCTVILELKWKWGVGDVG